MKPWIPILCALGIANVEGFFYSRIASEREYFAFPFTEIRISQAEFFFMWGFILVTALFLLGSIVYESVQKLIESTTTQTAVHKLKKASAKTNRIINRLRDVESKISELNVVGQRLQTEPYHSTRYSLDTISKQLEELRAAPPDWAQATSQPLSKGDISQLELRFWLLLIFGTGGGAVLTIIVYFLLQRVYFLTNSLVVFAIASGVAVAFISLGLLWAPPSSSRTLYGRLLRIAGATCIVGIIGLSLWTGAAEGQTGLWLFSLLIGFMTATLGAKLASTANALELCLLRIWNFLLGSCEAAATLVGRLFWLMLLLLEVVLRIIAAPTLQFIEKRRKAKRETP